MVVTPGRNRRRRASRAGSGLAPGDTARLLLHRPVRPGRTWAGSGWRRLGGAGIHFVGFHPAPERPAGRTCTSSRADEWTGADLAASTDAIVAKAGYGTVCEAMVAGTPMIYPPRTGFAEYRVLDRALPSLGRRHPRLGPRLRRARGWTAASTGPSPSSPARPRSPPTAPPASPSALARSGSMTAAAAGRNSYRQCHCSASMNLTTISHCNSHSPRGSHP